MGIIGTFIAGGAAVTTIQHNSQENVINTPVVNVPAVPTQGTNIAVPQTPPAGTTVGGTNVPPPTVPAVVPATTPVSDAARPAYATFLAGDYNKTIATKDGLTRSYIVHIPTGYDPKNAYPLVVVLHGGFGSGANVEAQTGMSTLADANKFIAVYPDGTANAKGTRTWNAGACCGQSSVNNIDDVGYIKQLVASLETTYHVNTKKVFATGMSNGGMLTNRLACEASDIFVAVAPVAGTPQVSVCNPKHPVPILMVHGTDDDNVPYNGGHGISIVTKNNTFISVPQTLADWSVRNKCAGKEMITSVPPLTNDGITIDKITYSQCLAPTILYRINGGAHAWPGSTGTSTKSFDASKTIWSFFSGF